MSKRRKKKKGKGTGKHRISSGGIPFNSIQQRIQNDREHMLSVLNFDEHLRGQVEAMFNINLEGISPGQEHVFFSTAVFKIDSAELATTKIEQLSDVDITDEDKDGADYVWLRPYPKGHWNPLSSMPGARQVIGHIHVSFDNTLKIETKAKSWMIGLIYYMMRVLGKNIKLIGLKFQNPMDMLSE